MRRWRAIGSWGIALAVLAPGGAALPQEPVDETAFDDVYAAFTRAYRDGDPAAVTALYTDDAYYLAPGDSIARGAVGRHFAWLDRYADGQGPIVEFEIVERDVAGDLGYDVGYYRIRNADAPADAWSVGKFLVIWKRGADGVWRIHADGFSGVQAAPEGS